MPSKIEPDSRALAAVIDRASRAGPAWRLPSTRDVSLRVPARAVALARLGKPEIFNTGQGSRFTGAAFAGTLAAADVRIPMEGRGGRESRGHDAAIGQRRRVARLPAAATATESSFID